MNANEKKYIEKIKEQYTEKETSKLDELQRLDNRVTLPAIILTYTLGILGSLILGVGMCITMKVVLQDLFAVGIIIGIIGIIMVSINYPLYKRVLSSRRKKYSNQIIEITNELLSE